MLVFELLESRTLLSGSQIVLGPPTELTDQPYVDVDILNGTQDLWKDNTDPYGVVPYNHLLLDTGANSITVVSDAAAQLTGQGLQNVPDYTFSDIGVGGSTSFNLSDPYQLNFAGTDGVTHILPQTSQDVRILDEADFISAYGIRRGLPGVVGMPAMVNRVTTLTPARWRTSARSE